MTSLLVWCLGLLSLLVPVRVPATACPLPHARSTCPARPAGTERCAGPCACVPASAGLAAHDPWWRGLESMRLLGKAVVTTGPDVWVPALLAHWLALGRLAVPLGVGGLLLGLLGLYARRARRSRGVAAPPQALGTSRQGQWARAYAACRGCGETTRRHHAHGLCRRCYARQRSRTPATPEGVEEFMA